MTPQGRRRWLLLVTFPCLFVPRIAPWLLAFPHHARAGSYEIWSESPIDQAKIDGIAARATALVGQSPLYVQPERRTLYLTRSGWRWHWLTFTLSGSFAISPPFGDGVIINSNSIAQDGVWNGRVVGGHRSLTGIVAHETCHGMLRRHFGLSVDMTRPTWLREGYCDYLAQESSLSEADYAALVARGEQHPALPYYEGRRRVAAILAANGGDVDALFAGAN
jgi:hypothetical protein